MSSLSSTYVRSILEYKPESGIFLWRHNGKIAGGKTGRGYFRVYIDGKHYASHRLAWLYAHGHWPNGQIDHINRDPGDNRIANLRDVSASENCKNRNHRVPGRRRNTKGYTRHKSGLWQVQLWCPDQKSIRYVGLFETREAASEAYKKAIEL